MADVHTQKEDGGLNAIDRTILGLITPKSKVLDLGCGDGRLLKALETEKEANVQGIEISEEAIYSCVEKGLSVFQSDIDTGLSEFPDQAFDYVVLNQSLQEVKQVDYVFEEALRVGRYAVVSFPNFAHLSARIHLFFHGRAPVTSSLPYAWNETPSVRFLSIRDFREFCEKEGGRILEARYLWGDQSVEFFPNLFATSGIFVITRAK